MWKFRFSILLVLVLSLIYCNPGDIDYNQEVKIEPTSDKNYGDVAQLLKDTFRIDIRTISVDMVYLPESFYVNCETEIVFTMFKDDTKPIIHLQPVLEDQRLVDSILLNGESLDAYNRSDVDFIEIDGPNQKVLEFQRILKTGIEHRLKISYRKNLTNNYYMFATEVSDLYGNGNESIFPTINRPGELALHKLRFRVSSDMKFRLIGSGLVQKIENDYYQEWTLDTEREMASYTVMFVLLPEDDTLYEEKTIDGVDVRIMAFKNDASIDTAFDILTSWLPELRNNLGPFPMKRGLSIMLMGSGGGMEYFGGTISSLWALEHEIFHMYYACSTVPATYRDSWLDEAVNEWYENSALPNFNSINDDYSSNIVSGRSPIGIGFDGRAYNEGAQMLEHIALNMGSRQAMISFLKYVHENYSFKPFTTLEFVQYLKDYSGLDYEDNFKQWLFSGETVNKTSTTNENIKKHEVNFTPPQSILNKYENLKKGVEK